MPTMNAPLPPSVGGFSASARVNEVMLAVNKAYPYRQTYPHRDPVRIRIIRGQVGVVQETGFENAVAAIAAGNAELVLP